MISAGDKIITYLEENPIELLYDPKDDDCEDSFELERFVLAKLYNQNEIRISYFEFDRRGLNHFKEKMDIFPVNFLEANRLREVSFFNRSYEISYDKQNRLEL